MGIHIGKKDQLDKDGKKIDDIAVITRTTEKVEEVSRTELISKLVRIKKSIQPAIDEIIEINVIMGELDG